MQLPCRQLFMRRVAETFQKGEIVYLRDQFLAMDSDHDGTLTYQEVQQV